MRRALYVFTAVVIAIGFALQLYMYGRFFLPLPDDELGAGASFTMMTIAVLAMLPYGV
jgi:hypothetical protein